MIFAKSNPPETLEEHTDLLKTAYEDLMELYGECFSENEKKMILTSISYHDSGKDNPNFQNKIRKILGLDLFMDAGSEIEIPHGYLSPAFIPTQELNDFSEEEKRIIYSAIIYHHMRDHKFDKDEIRTYINLYLGGFTKRNLDTRYLGKVEKLNEDEWVKFAIVKGILNKLDYWASSHSKEKIELFSKKPISKCVDAFMERQEYKYNDMQTYLKSRNGINTVVIASTGSGKTEGSMLWAGNCKLFYTLPLKVSINAMYSRIKEKYEYSEASLLHSDTIGYLMNAEKEDFDTSMDRYRISKNLSSPLTVCTIDQLATFCYKYIGSEIFLSTLKYSKLVIDEIQAYSPDLIAKIIYSLKLVKKAGGKYLIMTATLPQVVKYFMLKEGIFTKEELDHIYQYTTKLNRHKVELINSDFDYEKIREAAKEKKVLVVCNTVKKAQEVYKQLKGNNVFNLHARMISKDRTKQEERLLKFNNSTNYGIWITTQVVEASIDIDFDVLFTEMCSADALLQRLGRVYRTRAYAGADANVYVYNTGNGVKYIYDETIYNRSVRFLEKYTGSIFTEESKLVYVDEVYNVRDKEVVSSKYFKDIKSQLEYLNAYDPGDWKKEDAMNKFRDIETINVIPKGIYDKLVASGIWDELTDDIRSDNYRKKYIAENKLKDYSVPVRKQSSKKNLSKPISDIDIFIIDLIYDFDDTGSGIGLDFCSNELSDDNYL